MFMLRRLIALAGIFVLVLLGFILVWEVWTHASGRTRDLSGGSEMVESAEEKFTSAFC